MPGSAMPPDGEFTLAERDRRWVAVRAAMADRGVDIIIIPPVGAPSSSFDGSAAYLLGSASLPDGLACVLAHNGPLLALAANPGLVLAPWSSDVRNARGG